jgi:hypothetical protein
LILILIGALLVLPQARAQATQVVALGYNLGPVPPSLTNAVAVGVIGYSIAALRADGSIAQWGNSASDPGVSNLVSFVSGWSHAVGQRADGTITGWGDDSYGEISGIPAGLTNVATFAAGTFVTLAVLPDGSLMGWGDPSSHAMAIPPGATNIVSVAAVDVDTLALRADGTVLEWTYNATNNHPELSNVVAIATDGYNGAALLFDGTVVTWPDSPPDGLTNVTAIAGGGNDFLALHADGTLTGWGCICHGAVDVASISNVTAFAIGGADGYTESAFVMGLPPLPAPVLTVQRASSNLLRFRLNGSIRRHYVLEESTNLGAEANWIFKQNIVLCSSTQTFDLPVTGEGRFYRARLLP